MKSIQPLILSSLLLTTACTSMKVSKDEVRSVQRVAIVGYDVQQQRPVEAGDLFKIATHQNTASQAEIKGREESPHIAKMYDLLRQKLETENHWQIMSQESLRNNKAYQEYFRSKTEGFQNRPLINDRYTLYQPLGVLDSFALYTTEPEKLKKLQADLGVDALLIVGVQVHLNNSSMIASLVGQGKFSPYAETGITLLDAKNNVKIWFDGNAKGEPVENNEKNFMGMASQEKLNSMAIMAAESSYNKLLSNYKDKLSQ